MLDRIPDATKITVAACAALVLFVAGYTAFAPTPAAPAAPPPPTLATLEAKLTSPAGEELTRADAPQLYRRLGAERFAQMNELLRWTALAAALSPHCPAVTNNALSTDYGDRQNFVFFADCTIGGAFANVRFYFSEAEAKHYRDALSALGPSQPITGIEAPLRLEEMFGEIRTGNIMSECQTVLRMAAVSPDIDFAWDQTTSGPGYDGIYTVQSSFTARNAFNARLNMAYRCAYDVRRNRIHRLETRDFRGWRTLLGG